MEEITTEEQKKYWDIFISLNPINGYLSGYQAAEVLKNSKLPNEKLEKIWNLADIDNDGNLDFEEFCIAMRLIFDIINHVYLDVPSQLPDFLIPTSKAHLIVAQQVINENTQNAPSTLNTRQTNVLRDDFDWYIQPSDKQHYDAIYTSNADCYGRISFDSLRNLYAIIDISNTELRDAWQLVNPQLHESIEKDQAIFFLHILNQRNKGIRVPNVVPANLRATFEKKMVDYDAIKMPFYHNNDQKAPSQQFSKHTSNKKYDDSKETHITNTKNNWDEKSKKQDAHFRSMEKSTIWEEYSLHNDILRELEQMLEFKKNELKHLKEGNIKSIIGMPDLESVKSDILVMKQQIDSLGSYLIKKTDELQKLHDVVEQET